MTVSELVRKLEVLAVDHGDCAVKVTLDEDDCRTDRDLYDVLFVQGWNIVLAYASLDRSEMGKE